MQPFLKRTIIFAPYHLAAKMGIALALVAAWESGATEPNTKQRQMLAKALKSEIAVCTVGLAHEKSSQCE